MRKRKNTGIVPGDVSEKVIDTGKSTASIEPFHVLNWQSIAAQIHEDLQRENYIKVVLENLYKKYETGQPTKNMYELLVSYCSRPDYAELFWDDEGGESVDNKGGIKNDQPTNNHVTDTQLMRELLNHCLGRRGRNKWFPEQERKRLLHAYAEITWWEKSVRDVLKAIYPGGVKTTEQVHLLTTITVLMTIMPEQFAHIDKFVEQDLFLDAILSGKSAEHTLTEMLQFASTIEMKNTGAVFNYRIDNLFDLLYAADIARRKPKNSPERAARNYFEERYSYIQPQLRVFLKGWHSDLYEMYVLLTNLYIRDGWLPNESAAYHYLRDIAEQEINVDAVSQTIGGIAKYIDWMYASEHRVETIYPPKNLPFSKGFALTYITEQYIRRYYPSLMQEFLAVRRSPEAIALSQESNGTIVLRMDGFIDFYSKDGRFVCKGAGLLKSTSPSEVHWDVIARYFKQNPQYVTSRIEPHSRIVHSNYNDIENKQWMHWYTYFMPKAAVWAEQEADIQQLTTLSLAGAKFLRDILGDTDAQRKHTLDILFGTKRSGCMDYCTDTQLAASKWNPRVWKRKHVWTRSYMIVSVHPDNMVNQDGLASVYARSDTPIIFGDTVIWEPIARNDLHSFYPVLACASYEIKE